MVLPSQEPCLLAWALAESWVCEAMHRGQLPRPPLQAACPWTLRAEGVALPWPGSQLRAPGVWPLLPSPPS